MPLFRLMFDQSLRLSGMRYLTAENIGTFLRRPLPFICVLLILFLYTILEFFELGVLICLFDHCRHGEHATMGSAVLWSCRSCARLIRDRKNIRILPALLILSPFYHFATIINMFWSYSVSERVLKFIRMRWYRIAYAALLISLLLILFQRWMYLCHYYFLDGNTSSEAFHNSRLLGKKTHSVKSFWPLMQVQVIMTVLYVFFVVILLLMCDLARKLFSLNGAGVSSFQVMCINIGVSAFDAFILIISFACICELFYRGKHKIHEKIPYASLYGKHLSEAGIRRGSRRIERIMYAASILLAVFYVSFVSRRSYSLRVDGLQTMQVTAHRGASMFFPENTMPAFVGAVEQGADWIELDVQESADGQIYVMHDSNFIRTAGLDAFSWETDWNEIRGLDAGAFFSSEFAGTRIPLLSEALEFAK